MLSAQGHLCSSAWSTVCPGQWLSICCQAPPSFGGLSALSQPLPAASALHLLLKFLCQEVKRGLPRWPLVPRLSRLPLSAPLLLRPAPITLLIQSQLEPSG